MKKILTFSKEEARLLYNLLSNYEISNRSDNRKRVKFLEVVEDDVFKYEDETRELKATVGKINEETGKKSTFNEANRKVDELGEQEKKFVFNDREMFAKAKDIFEKCFEIGAIRRNQTGQVVRSPLIGRDAKIYTRLEDRFMEVKEEESKN